KRSLNLRLRFHFNRLALELVRLRNKIRRKRDTRRNVLIQSPQSFKHYLGPWLIDSAALRFHVHTEFERRFRKRQRVGNGDDSMQHADARINSRAGLKVEVSRTLWIQNFETAALSLVTEKLD